MDGGGSFICDMVWEGYVGSESGATPSIPHMRTPFRPIRLARSWGYLTGNWRKAITNSAAILVYIGEHERLL